VTADRPARRVVVTGLGVHCGLGDLASCEEALASGRSAVRAGAPPGAPGFPPSAIAPADLAPIRDAPADRKLHKYMSPATVLAVIAAGRALDDAGLLDDPAGRGNMALYMATGPIAFDFSTVGRSLASAAGETGRVDLRFVGQHGLRLIHPLMPFKMLLNMPLGLVSIVYGLRGDNVIAYPGAMQAAAVLEAAVRHIARRRFERALVGGAEQGVAAMPLALLKRRGRLAGSPKLVRPFEERHAGLAAADLAAFLVLESEESAAARGARALAEVSAPRPGAPASSERRRAPDRVLVTGSVDRGSDESVVRATDDVWSGARPVLGSLDGLAGYAASASLFAHLALGARAIDGAGAALETPRVHVVSLDPGGSGSAWVRLGPPAPAPAPPPAPGLGMFSSTCTSMSTNPSTNPSTDRGARLRAGERRRVVVTGMGVVSPIGVGRAAFFEGLATARSGIDAIRSFDAATFPTRVAGEVRGLDVASVRLPDELAAALRADP
jgi:3-oxoacyl-[acyl-carrier-protein] synthase II